MSWHPFRQLFDNSRSLTKHHVFDKSSLIKYKLINSWFLVLMQLRIIQNFPIIVKWRKDSSFQIDLLLGCFVKYLLKKSNGDGIFVTSVLGGWNKCIVEGNLIISAYPLYIIFLCKILGYQIFNSKLMSSIAKCNVWFFGLWSWNSNGFNKRKSISLKTGLVGAANSSSEDKKLL